MICIKVFNPFVGKKVVRVHTCVWEREGVGSGGGERETERQTDERRQRQILYLGR